MWDLLWCVCVCVVAVGVLECGLMSLSLLVLFGMKWCVDWGWGVYCVVSFGCFVNMVGGYCVGSFVRCLRL